MAKIDISGLDKAEVLAALYNGSQPMGMGLLQARSGEMTKEMAQSYITENGMGIDDRARLFPGVAVSGQPRLDFDYLFGRPLKSDITDDVYDSWLYDRDNGSAFQVLKRAGLVDESRLLED